MKNGKSTDDFVERCMSEYGWYSHYVSDVAICQDCELDDAVNGRRSLSPHVNAHTHGFGLSWKHLDFQIVVPMNQDHVGTLFHDLAIRVKAGEVFTDGQVVEDLITDGEQDRPVRLMLTQETGREVLRILFPDTNWLLPGDTGCSEIYDEQPEVNTA